MADQPLYLEQLTLEARQRRINLDTQRRLYLSQDGNYILKFHSSEELDRVSRALVLQDSAYRGGFPCSLPIRNGQGSFTQEYDCGFVTADKRVLGERLDDNMLWCDEVSFFIRLFHEFQKGYNGPRINHQRKSLGELVRLCDRVHFPKEYLNVIQRLSQAHLELDERDSIIHGDILSKNIIKTPNNKLVLIDFEKVMLGTGEDEAASSIFYTYMGTGLDLMRVYNTFLSSLQGKMLIDTDDLRMDVVQRAGEYLLHKNINHNLGKTKRKEIAKAERYFSKALKIFTPEINIKY